MRVRPRSVRIGVIDHHAGNLVSVRGGLERAGAEAVMVENPEALGNIDGVVLPGVGAAPPAMRRLIDQGLDQAIRQWRGPLLGICLGMQLLFEGSDEFGGSTNLGLLSGRVRPLPEPPRAIHMGWNDVSHHGEGLFAGIPDRDPFYFVHSFAATPTDLASVTATSEYGGEFVAAVASGNVAGVQFHPERSGRTGLLFLANFVDQVRRAA